MAAQSSSTNVVLAALGGNFAIAITKFAAGVFTGSSAMLTEGVHSLIDTGNQLLMLYGIRRSGRPADAEHPFGYGKELYFWTFLVAILLFALGAGVSIYEGVLKTLSPHPISDAYVNYIVLALGMVFEGISWAIALRVMLRTRRGRSLLDTVHDSKDPTVFTVLFEDTAALLGLLIAFLGILGAELLHMPVLDGIASIGIGIILGITAIFLAYECKSLLTGEAADPQMVADIRAVLRDQPGITGINEILTMHFGPNNVLVAVSVDFEDSLTAANVEASVTRLESRIRESYPEVDRVFIEAQSFGGHRRARIENPHDPTVNPA